jgi:hypothetical protein
VSGRIAILFSGKICFEGEDFGIWYLDWTP